MSTLKNIAVATAVAAVTCIPAAAQQATPPYGAPISLEQAKKVIAAAEAEAQKNNFFVVITVVDPGGYVVSYASARQHPAWIDSCCRRKGAHGSIIPSPIQGI
jgi:hypothetical protein